MNVREKSPFLQVAAGAAGGLESKVSLQQGHSLHDWVRLTNSGQDLAGVGGKILQVTKEELAKHNTETDCWVALKGNVYNVTAYLPFHPGGVSQLMRGAGDDCSFLFDLYHSWVNYQQMLKACLVGRLVSSRPGSRASPGDGFKAPSPVKQRVDEALQINWDVVARDAGAKIVVDNPGKRFTSERIFCRLVPAGAAGKTSVFHNFYLVFYHENKKRRVGKGPAVVGQKLKPLPILFQVDSFELDSSEDFKFEVEFRAKPVEDDAKKNLCIVPLVSSTSLHGKVFAQESAEFLQLVRTCSVDGRIEKMEQLSDDSRFYEVRLAEEALMPVPAGRHVQIGGQSTNVSRFYTPVLADLDDRRRPGNDDGSDAGTDAGSSSGSGSNSLFFIIKIYQDGAFTSWLQHKKVGDVVRLSPPMGHFDWAKMVSGGVSDLILLAAGTGITPMIKLIDLALQHPDRIKTYLMYFNKTQKDILWRDQLEARAERSGSAGPEAGNS